jgi:hypothetical protein
VISLVDCAALRIFRSNRSAAATPCLVCAGEIIPIDGSAMIDESAPAGEPIPRDGGGDALSFRRRYQALIDPPNLGATGSRST